MARRFNSVSTDSLVTQFSAHNSTRTYSMWSLRLGAGGGNLGRFFDKRTGGAQVEVMYSDDGGPNIEFTRNFDTGANTWRYTGGNVIGVLYHYALTYNSSSTTNQAVLWVNGVKVTFSQVVATAVGNALTNTDRYVVGNRTSDNARNFGGIHSEFAIWNRILNDREIVSLSKGFSPAFFPNSLVEYVPLEVRNVSYKNKKPTLTGTILERHPRIIYPRGI